MTIVSILLAALGLGFLVFIHELGHYFVARRVGMRVEVFSIGFGPVLYKWQRNGVRWQICALLFGGYVKIRGMDKEGAKEPHQIPDGFFGKRPIDRIKVAIMGPVVNILFALFVFCLIWVVGGRLKPFAESTKLIGWVQPNSSFAEKGLEPGDEIDRMGRIAYKGWHDLLYNAVIRSKTLEVSGQKIDYYQGTKAPFHVEIDKSPQALNTIMALQPASFLICKGVSSPLNSASKEGLASGSGLQSGDRLVWADGALLFSQYELAQVINHDITLLTVQRGGETFVTRVPRLLVRDIRLLPWEIDEIDDWQHETGYSGDPKARFFLPYKISYNCVVEGHYSYLDRDFVDRFHDSEEERRFEIALKEGDRIIAIDGKRVDHIFELFDRIQSRHVNAIVYRAETKNLSRDEADRYFIDSVDWAEVYKMAESIGTGSLAQSGSLYLLEPIVPQKAIDFPMLAELFSQQEKESEKIKDNALRQERLVRLEQEKNKLVLGVQLTDKTVRVNTNPFVVFGDVIAETYRTLYSLVTGALKPKYISGPVGIVQVMQTSWQQGAREALYWLGVISLNLGILNLLPLPVLDGGHIALSFVEMVRKKPLTSKAMQRIVIPFVILMILFFIFITWQDILRIFHR